MFLFPVLLLLLLFSTYALQPSRLIVRSGLDVQTLVSTRVTTREHPSGGRWNCGREMFGEFCLDADLLVTFRDLLHAVKLHGTDGFTSLPFALKIRRLRPGVNLANVGTKGPHATSRPPKPLSSICFFP